MPLRPIVISGNNLGGSGKHIVRSLATVEVMETRDGTAPNTQGATHMDLYDKRVPEVVEKQAPFFNRTL